MNGLTVYKNYSGGGTVPNNYVIFSANEAQKLEATLNIQSLPDGLPVSQLVGSNLLITVNVCTGLNWRGVTDILNFTGDYSFIRAYDTKKVGSCTVKGTSWTGTMYTTYVVLSPIAYHTHSDSYSTYDYINGTFGLWGGGYSTGGEAFSTTGFTVEYFTPELAASLESSILQNEIINQNQQIIDGQNSINNSIQNGTNAIVNSNKVTQDKLDDIRDMDISSKDKELPNDDSYQSYQDKENTLKDSIKQADLSAVSIGIDHNTSSFVWDTLTDFIHTHTLIFTMFISILSIGIIKLMFGR